MAGAGLAGERHVLRAWQKARDAEVMQKKKMRDAYLRQQTQQLALYNMQKRLQMKTVRQGAS